jgi:hypothetical protein
MEGLKNRMVPWRGGGWQEGQHAGKLGIYSSERGVDSLMSLNPVSVAGAQNRKKDVPGPKYK